MLNRWLLAVAAGVILGILALYPQYNLQKNLRGAEFSGAFASCDLDEMAYASYLQALIDGRPRKNDPYTGRDDSAETPQYESLFSIQFFPAYLAAIPARVLGLSASQMMPVLSFVSAFLTALAIFWLIVSITGDEFIAFAGTLVVLVGSALIVGLGAINSFYDGGAAYPFFPYLRRYIPSLAFPFLFAFFACLWNGLKSEEKNKRIIYSVLSSLCFAAVVFAYFYVWTSAGAVLIRFDVVCFDFQNGKLAQRFFISCRHGRVLRFVNSYLRTAFIKPQSGDGQSATFGFNAKSRFSAKSRSDRLLCFDLYRSRAIFEIYKIS